jgi:hypothetical protein
MTQELYAHMNNKNIKIKKKNLSQKRAGGVAEGAGPEFKPQYHKEKNKKEMSNSLHPDQLCSCGVV